MTDLTPDQATDLAERITAAIDFTTNRGAIRSTWDEYARERVASDLAGLNEHHQHHVRLNGVCRTCRRYADGLRRAAAAVRVTL